MTELNNAKTTLNLKGFAITSASHDFSPKRRRVRNEAVPPYYPSGRKIVQGTLRSPAILQLFLKTKITDTPRKIKETIKKS